LCQPDIQPTTDVVLLDDAYQHRYVKPDINILLMDYHRLIYFDALLPAGKLREPKSGKSRADMVIVTKCPTYITPMDMRGIERTLELQPWQKLYFTTYQYPDTLKDVGKKPLLVTGIASPQQIEYDLKKMIPDFELMAFPDHHAFTRKDIERIKRRANGRTILTTEKDATRLFDIDYKVIPIEVKFLGTNKQEDFNQNILNYVRKNKRNSCLSQGENAHKA
jgi:tetraacyldisaccharide 4'-kinase